MRFLILLLLFTSSLCFAGRVVFVAGSGFEYQYVRLSNPSNETQTVDIVFTATGDCSLGITSVQSGHGVPNTSSVSSLCPAGATTASCLTNKSTYRNIPPGGNLFMGVHVVGCGDISANPISGTQIKIIVEQATGHLTGHVQFQQAAYLTQQSILNGRAF